MNRRLFLATILSSIAGSFYPVAVFGSLKRQFTLSADSGYDHFVKDYLYKLDNFNDVHPNDLIIDSNSFPVMKSALKRFERIQKTVGFGNFSIISMDKAFHIAKLYTSVGRFTREELDFLESIFYRDSSHYGFWGDKPVCRLTESIDTSKAVKIYGTGNYLYKGPSLDTYNKLKQKVGNNLVMTSGLRGIPKQFLLFLKKAESNNGNLSLASRSLAPPGYSLHGTGDFDVGQRGYGAANFTNQFTETTVFKQLIQSDIVDLRYVKRNNYGVRYEPWHIKVV